MPVKEEHHLQIIFMNMGGLPQLNAHYKNKKVQCLTIDDQVNVLGLAEININRRNILSEHRLGEHTLMW